MHDLVRIITDDSGDAKTDPESWHIVDPGNPQGRAALCTGEFFGVGESSVTFKVKSVTRGGVTCAACLRKIKLYKRYPL